MVESFGWVSTNLRLFGRIGTMCRVTQMFLVYDAWLSNLVLPICVLLNANGNHTDRVHVPSAQLLFQLIVHDFILWI